MTTSTSLELLDGLYQSNREMLDRSYTAMSNMASVIGTQIGLISQLREELTDCLDLVPEDRKRSILRRLIYAQYKSQMLDYAFENRYERTFTENQEQYEREFGPYTPPANL